MASPSSEIEAGVDDTGSGVERGESVRPPRVMCKRRGWRPGAFNVRAYCNLRQGHAGPCDYSGPWGRRGTWSSGE